jgi:hypothetical protein
MQNEQGLAAHLPAAGTARQRRVKLPERLAQIFLREGIGSVGPQHARQGFPGVPAITMQEQIAEKLQRLC